MTIDLDGLQKLLGAATMGPLSAVGGRLVDARGDWIAIVSDGGTDADMRWIAAVVNAAPALLNAARERDTLREQNARLVGALEWALGEGPSPFHAKSDGDSKARFLTHDQVRVFDVEERRVAARRVLTSIRPKALTNV